MLTSDVGKRKLPRFSYNNSPVHSSPFYIKLRLQYIEGESAIFSSFSDGGVGLLEMRLGQELLLSVQPGVPTACFKLQDGPEIAEPGTYASGAGVVAPEQS